MSSLWEEISRVLKRKEEMIRTPSGVQEVGKCTHRTAVTLSNTPVEITLTAGMNSIEVLPAPTETKEVYYGGAGVNSTDGVPLGAGKIWTHCKEGWSVYLVADGAETPEVRICEYAGGE